MPVIAQEIQQTLESYRNGEAPEIGMLPPDIQKDWTVASGFQAYNLEKPAKMLFPQLTPIRNLTPRTGGSGKQSEFKAVTGVNTAHLNGWVAEKVAAQTVTTATEDMIAVYKSMALADTVSFESVWSGRTFMDVKALAVTNLLRATMIQEENNMLFGQNTVSASNQQAPGAVGNAPTLTGTQVTTATTGGHLAATTTYHFFETVVTGMGESLPGADFSLATGSGSTNSYTFTPVGVAGQPIFGYNLYMGTTSSASAAGKVLVANLAGGTKPSSGTLNAITWLTNGAPVVVDNVTALGAAPPAADGSADVRAYNGLLTQIYGGTGATIQSVNGTLTVASWNAVFLAMWNAALADPDVLWVNAQEAGKITALTVNAGTPYFVVPEGEQSGFTVGYRAAKLTNQYTGREVPIRVHPTLPQGTMLFASTMMPGWYVPSDVPNIWDLNVLQDYIELDYPPTQANPYWQTEVRLSSTIRLYLPLLFGVLNGISNN